MPAEFVGEAIARALIDCGASAATAYSFIAHKKRATRLPHMLADAGLRLNVVAAYRTVFVRDDAFAEKAARADVLTFTSAGTVRGFCRALGGDEAGRRRRARKIVACIGPVTAEAAREAGLHVDVVAAVLHDRRTDSTRSPRISPRARDAAAIGALLGGRRRTRSRIARER